MLVAGITGHSLFSHQMQRSVQDGERFDIAGYTLHYQGATSYGTDNFTAEQGRIAIEDAQGNNLATLTPALHTYRRPEGVQTSEAAIYYTPLRDIYAVFGHAPDGAQPALRIYDNPMISFVWLGCLMMFAGGLIPVAAAFFRKARP